MDVKTIFSVLVVSLLCSAGVLAQNYIDYFNQGRTAFESGDNELFLENLIKSDSLRPNHRVILFTLARAYAENNREEKAFEVLKKVSSFYASETILDSVSFSNLIEHEDWGRLAKNIKQANQKIKSSELAFQLKPKNLHLEGIEYDAERDCFYLTDVRTGKIYKTDRNGSELEVLTDLLAQGYWAAMSAKTNPLNRQQLWVVSSAVSVLSGYDDSMEGKSALLLVNKETGAVIEEYLPPVGNHLFGDLVISSDGEVYISDSQVPKLFRLEKANGEITEAFSHSDWWSLQGLTLSKDESKLYVSDYITGVFIINLDNGEIEPLIQKNELLRSTDGLYLKGNKLIAIQNGTLPIRISVINLDEEGVGIESSLRYLDQANEDLEEPTLGTWVDQDLYYIGNSPWSYYNEDNTQKLEEWPLLKIMKLDGSKIE
ncbi:MAG: hypothetical protein JJ971_15690 [Balneolaceae bacterium]|nr:hypothetical protein [Balneolaceae bacterium]MBO6547843.1 hypothetical protein [Balneolaceae bacterium]MBO6648354.1 hypothetical protein [Balneolaceae bacterium]